MKKYLLISLLTLFSVKSFSQVSHIVQYDTTGNVYCSVGDTLKFYCGGPSGGMIIVCPYYSTGLSVWSHGFLGGSSTTYVTYKVVVVTDSSWYINVYGTGGGIHTGRIIFPSTGINELSNSNVKVFPNPCIDVLNVMGGKYYKIYDIMGKLILSGSVFNSSLVDLSGLDRGLYFVVVDNRSYKIIKD